MNSIEIDVLSLINNFSLNFKKFKEVEYANAFDDRGNNNDVDLVFQGISIVLKDSLLNEKNIDLFDFVLKYKNRKGNYIDIEEVSFCSSDGNLYLEFTNFPMKKKEFISFVNIVLKESLFLYKENVSSYIKMAG